MTTHEYKGHTIDVWVTKRGNKFDWTVKAGEFPTRKNSGELAPTEAVAESEALDWARRTINELIARGHG